jgi:hypothetical protein
VSTFTLNRSPRFIHVCGACCKSFTDRSVEDVGGWTVANLYAEVLLDCIMVWDRRVKYII